MKNDFTPIVGTLAALAKRLARQLALAGIDGEFCEMAAWEAIRVKAEERDHDRSRPGDQHLMSEIAAIAEMRRDAAHNYVLWDQHDLAHHGYQTVRLWSCERGSDESYAALPSGRWFRIDGELRRKP